MLSLLLFSCQVVFDSSQPHGLQQTSPPCPPPSPGACPSSCLLLQWCHSTSHFLLPSSPPAFNLSKHQGLFQWVGSAAYNESACNESVSCRESDITKGLTLSLSLTLLGLLEQQQWNIHSHTLSSQSKRDIRFCSKESLKYLIFPWHGINEVLMVPWY